MRVSGSAKAEFDELRQRAEAGGYDLAGSMSEAMVRIIRQISAELRDAAGTSTDPSRALRTQRRSDVTRPINGTASGHNCGVEGAAAEAACSLVWLRGGPIHGIAPGSISAVHTGVPKTSAVAMQSWVDVLRTFSDGTRHSSWDDFVTCKPLKTQRRHGDSKRRSNALSP